jgi:PleD family two-component response regulator
MKQRLRLLIVESRAIPLTISIGVIKIKPGDVSAADAPTRTDRAVYRAKERGRNRVSVETQ